MAQTITSAAVEARCVLFQNFVIFMAVFLLVFVGFVVSFNNLYWYFDVDTRQAAETPVQEATVAETYYGRLVVGPGEEKHVVLKVC